MSKEDPFEKWSQFYREGLSKGHAVSWPSETLVRLMRGSYIPGLDRNYTGKSVLEVGFGSGNNLPFLMSLGLQVHGVEVSGEICKDVALRLGDGGAGVDLRVGTNRDLPFPDESFDFLVSWNVLHYENTEELLKAGLPAYRRVLKPGGRMLLSTTGPDSGILKGAKALGGHRYLIGREDDFRKGQIFFYFDAPQYVEHYLRDYFTEIRIGRATEDLFTDVQDAFIITAIRGRNS